MLKLKFLEIRFIDSPGLQCITNAAFDPNTTARDFEAEHVNVDCHALRIKRTSYQTGFGKSLLLVERDWGGERRGYLTFDIVNFLLGTWFSQVFESMSDKDLLQSLAFYMDKANMVSQYPCISASLKCQLTEGNDFLAFNKSIITSFSSKIDDNTFLFNVNQDSPESLIFALERECITKLFVVM